jgi:AraC-like DNA-binding protein
MKEQIRTYHFLPVKYGKELLMDIGRIEQISNYNLGPDPHRLSFYEILFIDRGAGYFIMDGKRVALEKGRIIFTSPGHIRSWQISKPVGGYALYFEKDFLNRFFRDELFLYRLSYFHQYDKATAFVADKTESGQYREILCAVTDEIGDLQHDSQHLLRALVYQLLILLNRSYTRRYGWRNDTQEHPVFYRFRYLVEKQYATHHRVVDYLELLQTNASTLNRLCKKFMGISAQQLIHQKQVSEIKQLLSVTDEPVADIAYKLNFSDPSNFNRFFRSITGITPHAYRQML